MTAVNHTQVSVVPPPLPPESPLQKLIDQWKKEGLTLELIVAMIMSNPENLGAMDVVSDDIAGITAQSNILSDVQADTITLDSILSKIESQLGTGKTVTIGKFPSKLLHQLQAAYKKLFVSNSANPNGESDLAYLKSFENKYSSVKPVVGMASNFGKSLNNPLNFNGGSHWFGSDIQNWTGSMKMSNALIADVCYLAEQHYDANHPSTTKSPNMHLGAGTSTVTDYLAGWWQSGNQSQTMESGVSQQDTTEVQSFMQLLQGFDSSAQQDMQTATAEKTQMIQNQKTAAN